MNPGKTLRPDRFCIRTAIAMAALFCLWGCSGKSSAPAPGTGGILDSLARPRSGRSMRATSAMRVGEIRRGPEGDRNAGERRYDPKADPRGDDDVQSNWDNFNVPPGGTHVLLDEKGPGVITHIWITFLSPEAQDWAPQGSADHQELMLRIYWDGNPRPAVEAKVKLKGRPATSAKTNSSSFSLRGRRGLGWSSRSRSNRRSLCGWQLRRSDPRTEETTRSMSTA